MKIEYLLETLDKSRMCGFWDVEDLGSEFGLSGGSCYGMRIEDDFKECEHRDVTWLCTDTLVGIFFLFLHGEFVGVRVQTARTSDSQYYWKDAEAYHKVKNWFWNEFKNQMQTPEPSLIDFDMDLTPFKEEKENQKALCSKWK